MKVLLAPLLAAFVLIASALAAAAPVAEGVADLEPMQEYGLAFASEIARDQHFPREALRQGWAGRVEVRVTVGADGRLGDVSVIKSSGHTVLDDEAVAKVMRARGLPQAPTLLAGREFTLSFPVVFRLE